MNRTRDLTSPFQAKPDPCVLRLNRLSLAYSPVMVLSRGLSAFLASVGVWTWIIWPRFAVAIWNDPRSWSGAAVGQGSGTGFLWVHALLIGASLAIGTGVAIVGVRGWRAAAGGTR